MAQAAEAFLKRGAEACNKHVSLNRMSHLSSNEALVVGASLSLEVFDAVNVQLNIHPSVTAD